MTHDGENIPVNRVPEHDQNASDSGSDHRLLGIRRSYLWALFFTALVAVWMLSGDIIIGGQQADNDKGTTTNIARAGETTSPIEKKLFSVTARLIKTQPRDATLVIRGRTEADAKVSVMTETSGVVLRTPAKKGSYVEKGTILCELEPAARAATVSQHRAALDKAQADSLASSKLVKRGYAGKLKVTTDQAQLDAAKAAYDLAKLDLDRTKIKAPFSGIIEEQPAKIGAYLIAGFGSNMACAVMVDIDPLIVIAAVSERDITKLKPGMKATVKLATAENVIGTVRYIATSADPKTRTFRVEIAAPNKEWKLRDGVTADIIIPLKAMPAHYFSPAILCLNDAGQIGVRLVEENNIVKFKPVTILANDMDGVWVSGLPPKTRLITVGQEYVVEGQKVIVHEEATMGAL